MCLSIAEQPFGDDAGLQGEQANLDVPLGGQICFVFSVLKIRLQLASRDKWCKF